MFTNYSSAEQRLSSPYFGNTFVRHSTVNYEQPSIADNDDAVKNWVW